MSEKTSMSQGPFYCLENSIIIRFKWLTEMASRGNPNRNSPGRRSNGESKKRNSTTPTQRADQRAMESSTPKSKVDETVVQYAKHNAARTRTANLNNDREDITKNNIRHMQERTITNEGQ